MAKVEDGRAALAGQEEGESDNGERISSFCVGLDDAGEFFEDRDARAGAG